MNKTLFENKLNEVIDEIKQLIIYKNEKYNFNIMQEIKLPNKIVNVEDRVILRIIEKLERIKHLDKYKDRENEYKDIIGYIFNLLVYKTINKSEEKELREIEKRYWENTSFSSTRKGV